MKILVKERVTLEGFTYQPGKYDVDGRIGKKLAHNWPGKVRIPKARARPKAKAKVTTPGPRAELRGKAGASKPKTAKKSGSE